MKLTQMTVQDMMDRMGSLASEADAARMLVLLIERGIDDTDEVTDADWFTLVGEACDR